MSGHGRKSTPDGIAVLLPEGRIIGHGIGELRMGNLLKTDEMKELIARCFDTGELGLFRLEDGNSVEIRPNKGIRTNGGLTTGEAQVMEKLVEVWNTLQSLDESFTQEEMAEFADGIHKCQSVLAYRVLHRLYPDFWRGTQ